MSAPETPSDSDPRVQALAADAQQTVAAPAPAGDSPPMTGGSPPAPADPAPPTHRKRPWGWMAVAGLLAVCVIGLGIYALNLNSDIDDADAQITSQQEQIDQAQETGVDIVASAQAAYEDLSDQLGAAQEDAGQAVDEAAEAQDQAEQAAAEAEDTADEAQKQADAAEAKAESAARCAQSFVSAFGLVFSGATLQEGVDAAVAELQVLQPQCAPALG
jgi:hypothetical protein